jgi:hypothetical protein
VIKVEVRFDRTSTIKRKTLRAAFYVCERQIPAFTGKN